MTLDVQYKINSDERLRKFIRENSYWYKELNRSSHNYANFLYDMKDKYALKPQDKLNKFLNNINMIQTFLDVLK